MIEPSARASWLLWLGLASGLALAIGSLAAPGTQRSRGIPAGAVAVVNGALILQADYEAELRRVAERERRPVDARDKQRVVERLIEDELMLERGIELGMVRADAPTRRALLGAVFAAERAGAPPPTAEELERFYRTAAAQLEQPGQLHLRQLTFRVLNRDASAAAHARAEDARQRLRAGEPFDQVRSATGADPDPDPLPDRPLALDELRDRLGPVSLAAATALQPGQVSDVLGSGSLLRVLVLIDRGEPELPPLQQIRERVQRMYEQQAADRVFAARIAALRNGARIQIAEQLP